MNATDDLPPPPPPTSLSLNDDLPPLLPPSSLSTAPPPPIATKQVLSTVKNSMKIISKNNEENSINPEKIKSLEEIKSLEDELAELEREEAMIREQEKMFQSRSHERTETTIDQKAFPDNNMKHSRKHRSKMENSSAGKAALNLLLGDLKRMINNSDYSDIAIIVEGKKVFCHKALLAIRCPFFQKIFETNKAAKELKMKEGVSYDVGMSLIEYLYTGTSDLKVQYCEDLYHLSCEYELPELQKICEKLLNTEDPNGSSRSNSVFSRSNSIQSDQVGMNMAYLVNETEKMREHRKKVAMEMFETEKTYVRSLKLIYDEFVCVLRNAATDKSAILTTEELQRIFSYWEVLLKCHTSLLKVIEERMNGWDVRPEIGDIFSEKTAFIKLYKHYINGFDKSVISIKELKERHPKFKEFLAKLEFTPKLSGLGLQSYLILPVQRIPRYVLLLQDMLKHTVEGHPDYANLQKAIINMKELADYINANKNDADEINKILAIQDRLLTSQSLVVPRRRLVREGVLFLQKDKFQVFLFTDGLLYCKPKAKDKLKFKGLILLSTSSLNTNLKQGDKHHFEIISQQGRFQFTSLPEEKDSWIRILSDTIEKAHKDLLNTAFSGYEKKSSEGSRQFQKLQVEENTRRRSELALEIKESEAEYTEKLEIVVSQFYDPINNLVNSSYPILPAADTVSLFSSLPQLFKLHTNFLKNLEKRVDTWDPNESMLGDLFLELIVDCLKVYAQYIENHPKSLEVLERSMANQIHFAAYVVQKEKDLKMSLMDLLEKPLRRLPHYYLILEELLQYTAETHSDSEKLKIVIGRLKEHVQLQKQQTIDDMKTKSTMKRKSSIRLSSGQQAPLVRRNSLMSLSSAKMNSSPRSRTPSSASDAPTIGSAGSPRTSNVGN